MSRIYLDYAATTPLLPEAHAAMEPWLRMGYGNPSSLHAEGRAAKAAMDESREKFADLLGCLFGEVIFTSSGTEAANLAVIGGALSARDQFGGFEVVLSSADHHCVLNTQPFLERIGFKVKLAPVNREGVVDLDWMHRNVGDATALVSVMHANNELGSYNPVEEIGPLCRKYQAFFHCDAVQTFPGDWKVDDFQADLVTLAAHKFYGPKGVGILYARGGVKPQPLVLGGGQEREVRAGTENVAGIVGAGVAAQEISHRTDWRASVRSARDAFETRLSNGFVRSVTVAPLLAGHCHVRYPGVDAETALIRLDREGVAASTGAACSSGSIDPSHVLIAAGYSDEEAKEGLRFTFGLPSTVEEAERAAAIVNECCESIAGWRASRTR